MESVLKASSIWDTVMADQYAIGLILMIQDITHKKYEKMQSTMAYVKAFLELFTTYQDPKQSKIDYYALFKSRRYTVTAHGSQPGYRLKLYDNHCKRLMRK